LRKAEAILAWAVDKMEERYALLARVGVRHISSYKPVGRRRVDESAQAGDRRGTATIPLHLPFIRHRGDEIADLI